MQIVQKTGLAVATCLGAGYLPVAPGTAGSLLALPLAWGVHRWAGFWGLLLIAIAALMIGLWSAGLAEQHFEHHDSRHIVVDELAGQLVTVLVVPCSWPNLVVAFGWFRLFDVLKPWPAGWADRQVGGGLGVMLDDLFAAVYAAAATAAMVHTGLVNSAVAWLAW